MSTLAVVADVLREVAPRALSPRQIVELAAGRLPTASRTPETVVSRDLALEVKRHEEKSRFLRAAPGEFLLKEALPTALYNDTDAHAAQWTRNLISAGQIAEGVVDERSIRDLKPADVAGYRQCHFFSGIGVWSRALRDAGWPDDIHVWSGSCPCGPWSQAGQKRGFDDNRHLWPDWFRLIAACRPAVVLGEQVQSKDGLAWLDAVRSDLEGADYTFRAAVRGYWSQGVEWIYCRPEPGHQDGRWRPVESGTQPLVDRPAPGVGRTRAKRLRGFGNAIVLPLATEFVGAVIDCLADVAWQIEEPHAAEVAEVVEGADVVQEVA